MAQATKSWLMGMGHEKIPCTLEVTRFSKKSIFRPGEEKTAAIRLVEAEGEREFVIHIDRDEAAALAGELLCALPAKQFADAMKRMRRTMIEDPESSAAIMGYGSFDQER
jgi:hypothetical protein